MIENQIMINGNAVIVKEYNGKRVVTFRDIDTAHKRSDGTARRNFNKNKKHFIEGVDFFVRNSYEAKKEFNIIAPNGLMLFTETGYYMLVKSFTDELSWTVQRELVNNYFKSVAIHDVRQNDIVTVENFANQLQKLMVFSEHMQEIDDLQRISRCNEIDIKRLEKYIKRIDKRTECVIPFQTPSLEQVIDYCEQFDIDIDVEKFWYYYESIGWVVNGKRITNWRARCKYWERNGNND